MKMSIVGNRVRIAVLLTLSMVVLLMLLMNHASPAQAQSTGTLMVSNLDQPLPTKYPSIVHSTTIKYYSGWSLLRAVILHRQRRRHPRQGASVHDIQGSRSEHDVLRARSGARRDHTLH